MFGKHYKQTDAAKDLICKDVSNRKWIYSKLLNQLKRVKYEEVKDYLARGWLLGKKIK